MKFKRIITVSLLATLGVAGPSFVRAAAGDTMQSDTTLQTPAPALAPIATTVVTTVKSGYEPFMANQLSLEAFGTYATRDRRGDNVNDGGGGLGVSYFITRYIGISADSYIEEWKWPYRVNGSAVLRLPVPDRLSPVAVYGFGGGGRQFKTVPQYTWHGGGGVEIKCCPHLGFFLDGREVFPDKTKDYTLVRAGVSFVF